MGSTSSEDPLFSDTNSDGQSDIGPVSRYISPSRQTPKKPRFCSPKSSVHMSELFTQDALVEIPPSNPYANVIHVLDDDDEDFMAGFEAGYEDLTPEEIEEQDRNAALIIQFVCCDIALNDLPATLQPEAIRRRDRAIAIAKQHEHRFAASLSLNTIAVNHDCDDDTDDDVYPVMSLNNSITAADKTEDEELDAELRRRHKQELEDEEFARQLQLQIEAEDRQPQKYLQLSSSSSMAQRNSVPQNSLPDLIASSSFVSSSSSSSSLTALNREMSIEESIRLWELEEQRKQKEQEEEDALLAKKIQIQLEKEERELRIAQSREMIKNRTNGVTSPIQTIHSNSAFREPEFEIPHSPRAIKLELLKQKTFPQPTNAKFKTDFDLSQQSPKKIAKRHLDRDDYSFSLPAESSSSSSRLGVSTHLPPVKYATLDGSPPSSFSDRYKKYQPPASSSSSTSQVMYSQKPIYDMSALLDISAADSKYFINVPPLDSSQEYLRMNAVGGFNNEDESIDAPLREGEVAEQLKDLLENVAITAAIPSAEERLASPDELKIQLLEHQKIGVDWMLKMEKGSNKGGILADDMGLGKTVQSITACILNKSENPHQKTSLIIAPTSLILQWKEELKTKVKPGVFKVFVYYGKDKKGKSPNLLKQYDIVITTYGTVAMEWPQTKKKRVTKKAPFQNLDEDQLYEQELAEEAADQRLIAAQKGSLFKVNWHRVILDEISNAHTIKNKSTRAARACVQLTSKYRWCLTGTPIQNNIGELYSLINFLQIKPYCNWNRFRDEIEKQFKAGKHKRVMKRVQALLKAICLRRTKNSTLDGKPIITLPPKHVELISATFTPAEREFYSSLEKRTLLKFNTYLKAGNVLVLLLRLRQACCHPILVAQNFSEASQEALEAAEPSIMYREKNIDPMEVLSPDIQQRLIGLKLKTAFECAICCDALSDGRIIPDCGHVYCGECIEMHLQAGGGGEKVCPECRGEIDTRNLVSVDLFLKSAKKAGMIVSSSTKRMKDKTRLTSRARGKLPALVISDESEDDDADEENDKNPFDFWISSTKIDEL
ncbi:hypothetical protein HK100_006633, partial [Physocladia obscura]